MTLQLHRPDGQGGLERVPGTTIERGPDGRRADWRTGLRAARWRPAPLRNTEMNPTPTFVSVLFWLGLAGLTFVLLLVGYGTHFWRL